jgi:cell division transport system ATP-binding protein
MITFRNVTKQYGTGEPVLSGVSFVIDKGAFAFLVGPTGSGKTSIFRLIIGDLTPSDGQIVLGELDLANLPKSKIPDLRRRVGVVFQDLKLLMDRTVAENIMLPLQMAGESEREARVKADEILVSVGLEGKGDKFPRELSGGERQRVAIARALIFNPEIILADEPTGNLDQKTSFQILDLLKSINSKLGTTIFMATHNDILIKSDDRVIVLENGKIKEDKKGKHLPEDRKLKSDDGDQKSEKTEKTEEKEKKNDIEKSEKHSKSEKKHEEEDEGIKVVDVKESKKINLEELSEK